MRRQATIRDVAAMAGCSVATVSRAINGTAPISNALRARIDRAIRDCGFRPNGIGRSLKTQRTRTLGVMIPSLANPVFADSVAGLEQAARPAGYHLLFTSSEYDPDAEAGAVEAMLSQGVEGLVLTVADPDDNPTLDRLDADGVPYVLLYNQPSAIRRPAVTVDNVAAMHELTERVLRLGHRSIGYVGGRFGTSDRSRHRYRGYVAALGACGLAPGDPVEVDYLADDHADELAAAFAGGHLPTALLCSNDLLALKVVGSLRRLGLAVPGDLSVVGFDGIPIGALVTPTLATVVQPTRQMGLAAFARLAARLDRDEAAGVTLLPHGFRPGATLSRVPGDPRRMRIAAPARCRPSSREESPA